MADMVHVDTGASFNHHSADIQRNAGLEAFMRKAPLTTSPATPAAEQGHQVGRVAGRGRNR
jgi:hypothetical protein